MASNQLVEREHNSLISASNKTKNRGSLKSYRKNIVNNLQRTINYQTIIPLTSKNTQTPTNENLNLFDEPNTITNGLEPKLLL